MDARPWARTRTLLPHLASIPHGVIPNRGPEGNGVRNPLPPVVVSVWWRFLAFDRYAVIGVGMTAFCGHAAETLPRATPTRTSNGGASGGIIHRRMVPYLSGIDRLGGMWQICGN